MTKILAGALASLLLLSLSGFAASASNMSGWAFNPAPEVRHAPRTRHVAKVQRYRVAHHRAVKRHAAKAAPRHVSRASSIQKQSVMPTLGGYATAIARSVKLADVVAPLANKVRDLINGCGAKVISGYRRGSRVAGSGRPSLHSQWPSRAVDLTGPVRCLYDRLRGWPGGYSTDYAAVRHLHLSYAPKGREWGTRFAHRGRAHYARRYYRARYAGAG